ncbi:MAG TPA: GDSL-type esterase/lipase family protein [Stellaceae bacterium]|jgi:lysophospholipase L1-like esterase|nr:GDSL-type esterase/lipase family protein [Stellaceae bacterium]
MRVPAILIALLGAALAARPALADDPAAAKCAAPPELIQDDPRLPMIAQALQQHKPMVIVVIGGASTAGTAPDNSFPHFLEAALRARHPGQTITVVNRGVAGDTTEQMAARFPKDVYSSRPSLVIWETGTVDSVRGEGVDSVAEALSEGLTAIQGHGAEAMLMDMQYNPNTVSVINFQPYLDALHQTADQQDVYMFKRYELMKYWSGAGDFNFTNVPREKRALLAREFYECLGERLADAIEYAAR